MEKALNDMRKLELTWRDLHEYVGLSEYEAKAYLSLIKEGTLEAGKLSIVSGVPRTKIYHILRKLTNSGLAVEVPGAPKKFAPNHPTKVFGSYLTEIEDKMKGLSHMISRLEASFAMPKGDDAIERDTMWIVQGMGKIIEKIKEMFIRAKESIIIIADAQRSILLYQNLGRLIEKLADKQIQVRIMTESGKINSYISKQLHTCKIVDTNISLPLIYVSVDYTDFLLAVMTSEIIDPNFKNEVAFYAQNQTLTKIFNFILHTQISQHPI